MRIALIAHHTAPIAPPFFGGVESQTWYLARWLAERGHDVTLFALPGSHVPGVRLVELQVSPSTFSERARQDVSTRPQAFLDAHHAYLQVLAVLARECPFDVVHVNTLHYLPVAMATSLPVQPVLSLHCPPTPWLESALQVAGREGPLPLAVTAVSHALAREWQHVVPRARVVFNGVDLAAWLPGDGGDEVAWVGRIVPEKAPHLAIAAARLAGRPIRLAGPIIDRAYWHAEVEPLLGRGASHVGHLSHRELGRFVGGSAVAVQSPVWEEPFGLTAAEAIACGTPVAAFTRGGLPEVVGPTSGRLARPDDVHALARAIDEAARLDRAAVRADAEARLSVDAMGRGYEAVYRDQLRIPPAAARHEAAAAAIGAAAAEHFAVPAPATQRLPSPGAAEAA